MRLAGIEPASQPWEGCIVPLDQNRLNLSIKKYKNNI